VTEGQKESSKDCIHKIVEVMKTSNFESLCPKNPRMDIYDTLNSHKTLFAPNLTQVIATTEQSGPKCLG